MRNLINLARLFIFLHISWCLRKKRIFVVCGMRRSGNHACINWLLNAIEESDMRFCAIKGDRVSLSASKKTVFFNEANFYGLQYFWKLIVDSKAEIREADNVIISLEDYAQNGKYDPFIPNKANKILIQRSLLNLVASRLQRALNQAKEGKDRGDMRITEPFFKNVSWIVNPDRKTEWLSWSFDDWLQGDDTYRRDFLGKLGLSFDSNPQMSTQGGGSSFTGQSEMPTVKEMQSRWNKVNWPDRILDLLTKHARLLNVDEKEFLKLKNTTNNI